MYHFPEGGSYQEFIELCLLKNEPCLFGEWATRSWGARREWVMSDGSPNFTFLIKEFGHAKVPVADCTQCHYSTHPKTEMLLSEYIRYWKSHDNGSHPNPSACDQSCNDDYLRGEANTLLYLKDWHVVLQFPAQVGAIYSPPIFMSSDWLNEVWNGRQDVDDDYKFVYMGPAGTWTPFHADVLRSYSWSANITGSKEWLFLAPKQEDGLRDKFGKLPFDVTSEEIQQRIKSGCATPPIRVVQGPGEIIFVPSGWHHQVRNLEPTISINHNWTNAFCLQNMWTHLKRELQLVKLELQDCVAMEGWDKQCQVVLKASSGMNYSEFAQFIVMVGCPRLQHFRELVRSNCSSKCIVMADTWTAMLGHFMEAIMTDVSKLSFFKDGTSPMKCQQVPDELRKCLHPQKSFDELLHTLPLELGQVVEDVRCKGQHTHSMLAFRAFEVYMLSCVAEKVSSVLWTPKYDIN